MSVPYITLNDGNKIPAVGYGCGTANYAKDAENAVALGLKENYLHIDAAEMYANSPSVGQAINNSGIPRDQIFLTTKCGINGVKNADPRASLEKSLKELNTPYVDLYLIHGPLLIEDLGKAWAVMEELQKEGLAKSIGVSNYLLPEIEETLLTAKVIPAINQIEFHPYLHSTLSPLLAACAANGITITTYGPLTPLIRVAGGPVDEVAEKVAGEMGEGVTSGQVLLKWAGQVTGGVVLTTSTKSERLREQLKAFTTLPDLTPAQMKAISEAGAKKPYRHFGKMVSNPTV